MTPKYFIGTSGWHYNHWRGEFYPVSLSRDSCLSLYAFFYNDADGYAWQNAVILKKYLMQET